jgi:hypothetical protein
VPIELVDHRRVVPLIASRTEERISIAASAPGDI